MILVEILTEWTMKIILLGILIFAFSVHWGRVS